MRTVQDLMDELNGMWPDPEWTKTVLDFWGKLNLLGWERKTRKPWECNGNVYTTAFLTEEEYGALRLEYATIRAEEDPYYHPPDGSRSRRQDPDLKDMSPGQLRREIMRLRHAIRKHRDAEEDARCWHNDLALYGVLPECVPPGRMIGPEEELLRHCRRYIRRQQCHPEHCPHQQ